MENITKIIAIGCCLVFFQTSFGQIKVNTNASTTNMSSNSAFLDATSSPTWNGSLNLGKGLNFPKTNLVSLTALQMSGTPSATSNPNRFDGMLVYNTATGTSGIGSVAVKPGFYYYKNSSTTDLNAGTWIAIGSDAIPAASNPTVVSTSNNYTILDTDSTILCDAATNGILLTLPVAAPGNSGKTFVISRLDNIASNLLSFSEGLKLVGGATVSSLNYARTLRVQSDGTNWNVID